MSGRAAGRGARGAGASVRAEGAAARVYRAYNAAENRRDVAAMTTLLAADVAIELNGRAALASADEDGDAMSALFAAFPEYRREIVAVVDGGDTAAVRWRMVGRPAAALADRLPDLDLHGCSVVTVREGRIIRAWLYTADGALDAILALARE